MALMKDRQNKGIEEDYLKKERPTPIVRGSKWLQCSNDKLPQTTTVVRSSETHRQHRHQSFRVYRLYSLIRLRISWSVPEYMLLIAALPFRWNKQGQQTEGRNQPRKAPVVYTPVKLDSRAYFYAFWNPDNNLVEEDRQNEECWNKYSPVVLCN